MPLSETANPNSLQYPGGALAVPDPSFGLHGAPPTFQRMMDILLRPHQAYAVAYLDDVVIHSERWEDHLDRLRRVLMELRRAGLTANPRKCHLGLSEAKYPGLPGRTGPHQAPGKEGGSSPVLPETQHEVPGTSLFGVGRVL